MVTQITLNTDPLLRTLAIAMLARTNSRWLVAYMAADFCAYVLYKTARGDIVFWMPGAADSACVCAMAMRHLMLYVACLG
jgi:hypothetical protein